MPEICFLAFDLGAARGRAMLGHIDGDRRCTGAGAGTGTPGFARNWTGHRADFVPAEDL